ncbi:MAG: hypothetical protein ABJG78_02720 [Cyclobacteriaceae bacterium]
MNRVGTLLVLMLTLTYGFCQEEKILSNHPSEDRYASYSPSGEKILFESNRNGNWDIYLMDVNGGNQEQLTTSAADDRRPDWHPSGKKVLFESNRNEKNQLYELTLKNGQINEIEIDGEPIFARYSPDGKQIAFALPQTDDIANIVISDNRGRSPKSITNTDYRTTYPQWSPNGDRILFFSRHETGNKDDEIYTINTEGADEKRLTNCPKHNFCPQWSKDGKMIAYATSMENSRPEIYIMDVDGKNQRRITNNADGDTLPSWSSDGKKLLVTGYRNGNYEICEITLER